jgi:hypothetical protein
MKDGKQSASPARPLPSWRAVTSGGEVSAAGFWGAVLLFAATAILFQLGAHVFSFLDVIGPDPDDSMRLVEVRDFLAGQNWFDLHQYRLGPDGGTLMHWSRLIDAPIAALILMFSQFMPVATAEAAAALAWPLLLVIPMMISAGLASYRLGGRQPMLIGLGLTALYMLAIIRFRPGALDHHNVQLVLAMFIAAMLIDPLARLSNFAAAGIAGAMALAIGAETTPLVAVAAMAVGVLWGVSGERYRRAAIGFGIAFAAGTGILFFGTTPVGQWSTVTCDTLSAGYFSLCLAGGATLATAAAFLSRSGATMRFAGLAAIGLVVALLAMVVAPQCLGNPLDSLDPLLKTMWLGSITEAQSILAEMAVNPHTLGGFYAVGLIGAAVAATRILRGQQPVAHSVLLALIAVSWLVSAYQIRGAIFANFLAFIPLSVLISDLRQLYLAQRNDARAAFAFVFAVLASIPAVWTISGVLIVDAGQAVAGVRNSDVEAEPAAACITETSIAALASRPPGRILSTSNPGSVLLRFTPHSVLTANYHRNQAGMLAALKISMAAPADAIGKMRLAGVDYIVLCDDDPQMSMFQRMAPRGLFSRLAAGDVPEFLEPITHDGEARLKLFKVL